MHILLTTYASRGDVLPLAGHSVQVRTLGAAGLMRNWGWR
jgi:hypothetical protein